MDPKKALSRRAIVTRGGAALIAAGVAGTEVFSWGASTGTQRSIKFTPASASGFGPLLDQHFPGLSADATFKQFRPLTFIIENDSSVDVRAHIVTWQITSPAGTTQVTVPQYFSPRWVQTGSPFFGVGGNRTLMSGQVPLMAPGGVRLASPLFTWSPRYYSRNTTVNWPSIVKRSTQARFLTAQAPQITSVNTTLGAVLFGDNVVVGDDGPLLAWQYSVRRNAERDAASAVNQLVASGAASSAVQSLLTQQAAPSTSSKGQASAYTDLTTLLHNISFVRQSRILLTRFLNVDYNTFVATIQYISQQPATSVSIAA